MLESSATVAIADSEFLTQKLIEFNRFLEYMPVAVAMFDRHRRCLVASARWIQDFGGNPDNLMSCSLERTTLETAERWQDVQSNSLAGATSVWEEPVVSIDGTSQWVKWKVQPWYDELGDVGGEVVCLEPMCDDCQSVEEVAQQSLQKLEDLKRAIDRTSSVSIADLNGNITNVNDRFCQISQYTREELLGQNHRILNARYHPRQFFEQMMSTLSSGQVWQGELKNRAKDGTFFWVEMTIYPCLDRTGKIYQYIAISNDISGRKQAEIKLQESQQFLQIVLDNIPQMIYWKDLNSVFLGCNRNGLKFANLNNPEDIIGKTDYDFSGTPEEVEWYIECDRQVMQSGVPDLHIIESQQLLDGTQAWLDTNKIPLRNAEGEIVGILVTIEDITAHKQAEEILQRSNEELEHRVQERTIELEEVVTQLKHEIRERRHVEEDLQEKEKRLREINSLVPGAIYQYETNLETGQTRFTYISPKVQEIFEVERDLILASSEPIWQTIHPDDLARLEHSSMQAAKHHSNWFDEFRIITASGQEKWIRGQSVSGDAPDGFALHNGVFIDISDRKAAEAKLQEQEQFLRSVYDGAELVMFVINVEEDGDFRYLDWNSAAERVTGIDRMQVIGKTPDEIYGSVSGKIERRRLKHCLATGRSMSYEESMNIRDLETYWITTINPLKDSNGKIYRIVGSAIDITDRKEIEAALSQSEAKFRHFVENANDLICSCTLDWEFTYLSPKFFDITGYEIDEFLGQSFLRITHPDDFFIIGDIVQQVAATGKPYSGLEFRVFHKNGRWIWLTSNVSPIRERDHQITGIQAIVRDITERKAVELQLKKQTEELENAFEQLKRTQAQMLQSEKMSSLGQMVAGVAHEINNPVNFIHGNLTHAQSYLEDLLELLGLYQFHYPDPLAEIQLKTEEIELEYLVEDVSKLFRSMRVGTNRIREIVLSLRNFSRLDESDFKESDIHQGLDSTLMILQNRLKSKTINFESKQYEIYDLEVLKKYGNLPLVDCYPGQLNQVFMNILSNAIDALEERDKLRTREDIAQNPGQISIETELTPSNTIRIRIKDNGIGIPEPIQNRIFDPFFTTKDVGKGTGLGMSISYQIITDRHKGSIYCMSSPGQGSEFIVEIPIHQKPRPC